MIYRQHDARCDYPDCGVVEFFTEEDARSRAAVRRYLRACGWTCGKRDLCPKHSSKREDDT